MIEWMRRYVAEAGNGFTGGVGKPATMRKIVPLAG